MVKKTKKKTVITFTVPDYICGEKKKLLHLRFLIIFVVKKKKTLLHLRFHITFVVKRMILYLRFLITFVVKKRNYIYGS